MAITLKQLKKLATSSMNMPGGLFSGLPPAQQSATQATMAQSSNWVPSLQRFVQSSARPAEQAATASAMKAAPGWIPSAQQYMPTGTPASFLGKVSSQQYTDMYTNAFVKCCEKRGIDPTAIKSAWGIPQVINSLPGVSRLTQRVLPVAGAFMKSPLGRVAKGIGSGAMFLAQEAAGPVSAMAGDLSVGGNKPIGQRLQSAGHTGLNQFVNESNAWPGAGLVRGIAGGIGSKLNGGTYAEGYKGAAYIMGFRKCCEKRGIDPAILLKFAEGGSTTQVSSRPGGLPGEAFVTQNTSMPSGIGLAPNSGAKRAPVEQSTFSEIKPPTIPKQQGGQANRFNAFNQAVNLPPSAGFADAIPGANPP